jgi:hypothetical protein
MANKKGKKITRTKKSDPFSFGKASKGNSIKEGDAWLKRISKGAKL